MTSNCLGCSTRPQTGQFGLCDQCRRERRDRVRESIRDDSTPAAASAGVENPEGQARLDSWGGDA